MTEAELEAVERLAARLASADWSCVDEEAAADLRRLLDEVSWLVSEVRRLRSGPGLLGALLRHRRLAQGLTLEQVARDASLRAGSVSITPEEVRALEEGTKPVGPRWSDVLWAIADVLGLDPAELPAS